MKRNPDVIAADVEMGLMLHSMMKVAKSGLEEISERLRADALAHPEEHKPLVEDSREGMQWTAPGGLTVILTADKLVTQFETDSTEHNAVRNLLALYAQNVAESPDAQREVIGRVTAELFEPWSGFVRRQRDGMEFRAATAGAMSGFPALAESLVEVLKARDPKTGLPQSDVKTEWAALEKDRAQARSEAEAKKLMAKLKKAAKAAEKEAA